MAKIEVRGTHAFLYLSIPSVFAAFNNFSLGGAHVLEIVAIIMRIALMYVEFFTHRPSSVFGRMPDLSR